MQCYTDLIPPSTITHAVALPFIDAKANNLAVVKTSLLQIYRIHETTTEQSNGHVDQSSKSKFALIAEYSLAGTVTSLASIKALNTKSGGDALLIAVKDAKLSLVEWDSENHKLNTVSIHYYEGDKVISQPFGPDVGECESILTVDPSSRCAALKFGAKQLAILPFRQMGDDLMEGGEDMDEDLDIAPPSATLKRTQSGLNGTVDGEASQTPYKSSFVLPLTALDPTATHPIDLSFLHEYREPTFGILSASMQPSLALLEERKDILSYTVFTLDLEQRASTNLISVQKLPSDLWKVVSLPLPVGGALLVGTNELVHVDQSGKTNAVAVNEFAKSASAFGMTDQSTLDFRLENCEIVPLDSTTGDLLVVLNDGSLAILTFKLSGRTVGGLIVRRVTPDNGGDRVDAAPSCSALLNKHEVFLGSEDGDSSLLQWTKPTTTLSRKRSHAQMLGQEAAVDEDEDDQDMDDDDLYAPTEGAAKRSSSSSDLTSGDSAANYRFQLLDRLPSLGPINNVCFGKSSAASKRSLEMLAATGRGCAGRLAFMTKELVPKVLGTSSISNAKNAWSLRTKSTAGVEEESEYDNAFFIYDGGNTKVYDIVTPINEDEKNPDAQSSPIYAERTGTEFEHEGETLSVSTLAHGTRIAQCRRSEIRTYDATDNLALSQIIPMMDEETDAELKIVHASFCDPYILIVREDSSVAVLKVDQSGDVEPLETEDALKEQKWLSGCLYSGVLCQDSTVAFLLGEAGGLHVFSLPDMQPIYSTPMLSYLPAMLSADAPHRRVGAKETLAEILCADIGSEDLKQTYLILRSAMEDLTLYEPFGDFANFTQWSDRLRFRKVPMTHVPKFDETTGQMDGDDAKSFSPLRSVTLNHHTGVLVPGAAAPSFIFKEATSLPKVVYLQAGSSKAKEVIPLHHSGCEHGFGIIQADGALQECQIPRDMDFGTGWCVQRIALQDSKQEVRQVAFHNERQIYAVASCKDVDFHFPEEEGRHIEQDEISLRPQVPQYTIHILSATTRNVIDSFEMPYLDTVTDLKIMQLEVSEHTHQQRPMIVVSTASQRGEDMAAKGAVNVFDILDVVPEPSRPESAHKLRLFSREETRGAVTAVESLSGGLIGTAQGQKIMVRGLKEDGSCLPVAFLDAQCHTVQLKSLAQSGMWMAGDAWKGLWFGGFTQEPYKLSVLGKSRTHMEIVVAEFLSFEEQLFILIVDSSMDLHVLQYDPENPKSLSGTRLLHRSTFHIGHFPSSMTLLPSTLAPTSEQKPLTNGHADEGEVPPPEQATPSLFQVLTTSFDGSVSLITPVDEPAYRRLGSIQTHLTSVLEHAAALNPRAYRAVESEGFGARGVVDGSLVLRISELGSARRAEVLGRAGADSWALRSDLEIIGGGGLGYL